MYIYSTNFLINREIEKMNKELGLNEKALSGENAVEVIRQILIENGFSVEVEGFTIKLGKGFSVEVDSQRRVLLIDRGLIREAFFLPEKMTRSWANQFVDVLKVHTGM